MKTKSQNLSFLTTLNSPFHSFPQIFFQKPCGSPGFEITYPNLRRIRFTLSVLLILLFNENVIVAQLIKENNINQISESEIYIHEETKARYSDLITIKFNNNIIDLQKGLSWARLNDVGNPEVKKHFIDIEKHYGKFQIIKLVPSAVWGDTLVPNKKRDKILVVPDWSQVFQLKFSNLVPIDSIITFLKSLSDIEYAEESFRAYSMIEPNDEKYLSGNNWAFKNIKAKEAWDITRGDSSIVIAIIDKFGDSLNTAIHDDLIGKVDSHFDKFGNHGTCVAGIAGANTNNQIGISSLGWNLHLRFYDMTYPIVAILDAINDGVDVINFSWVIRVDLHAIRDAIKTALINGIVCVASAGNEDFAPPQTLYPAAYNFGELGQVIAVSSTECVNAEELFVDGWNYSPGKDPLRDPTNSFIDVAAPGRDIPMLDKNCCKSYSYGCGTSLSVPFVSALAGLLLSIDSSLNPNDIYNIITGSADKIGRNPYNKNGWNQFLGFGRINAYRALRLVNLKTSGPENFDNKFRGNYELKQNYPNPFNPTTTIKYSVPHHGGQANVTSDFSLRNVSLKINDILGREVTTLVNEKQIPGNYEVVWDAGQFPSGVYFYRLQTDNFAVTKKMMLAK